jgi:Transcriptional regulator, AbiEi antitoxin
MRGQSSTREQQLAEIAFSQYGVVMRRQLLDAGFSRAAIDRRIERGGLLVVHPGVYRVGHRAPSLEARYLAAVLACGDGALLSGRAAGYLLGLLKGKSPDPEVKAPKQRRIEGIQTTWSRRIDPRDATTCRGIPVTTVPRTLVDMAAALSGDDLARACHEAGVRYRTTPAHVEAVLSRLGRVPGAPKLRTVLRGATPALLSKMDWTFHTSTAPPAARGSTAAGPSAA